MLSPEVATLSQKEHKSIFRCIHHISYARTEGFRRTVYLKLDLQRSQSQLKEVGEGESMFHEKRKGSR